MKSSLVEINQVYLENASPASEHKELESLYSKLPKDKVLLVDQTSFAKKIDNNRAQGILINAQVSVFQTLPLPKHKNECYVILDQVQDPHNLGQILRICAGGNVDDLAAAAFLHIWEDGTRAQPRSFEVHGHQSIPLLGTHFHETHA